MFKTSEMSENSLNKIKGALWSLEDYYDYKFPSHFVTIFQQVETALEVKMLIIALELIKKDFVKVEELIDLCYDELSKLKEVK